MLVNEFLDVRELELFVEGLKEMEFDFFRLLMRDEVRMVLMVRFCMLRLI